MQVTEKYIAEVIDNIDDDKEGKIKVFVEELMQGITDKELYPMARQETSFNADIPEIGDLIWVYFTDQIFNRNIYCCM